MRSITEIFIHCSDSRFGNAEIIDGWHRERGWDGIGYHFVVENGHAHSGDDYQPERDGHVSPGRDLEKVGAHVRGRNSHSIGVCLIGRDRFSPAQITAAVELVNDLRAQFDLPVDAVLGHYEADPGKTCPNLDMDRLRRLLRYPDALDASAFPSDGNLPQVPGV